MSPSPKKTKIKADVKPKLDKQWSITQKLEVIEKRDNGARWIKIK